MVDERVGHIVNFNTQSSDYNPIIVTGLLSTWAEFAATAWGLGGPWRVRQREPITGIWGRSPQRGPGAEPLVVEQGAKPPEAESRLKYHMSKIRRKITPSQCFETKLCGILTTVRSLAIGLSL